MTSTVTSDVNSDVLHHRRVPPDTAISFITVISQRACPVPITNVVDGYLMLTMPEKHVLDWHTRIYNNNKTFYKIG